MFCYFIARESTMNKETKSVNFRINCLEVRAESTSNLFHESKVTDMKVLCINISVSSRK